jgi:hypothetical protein
MKVMRPKYLDRRCPNMKIDKVLAVYNTSPLLLVVESDEGKLFELPLKDLKSAGHGRAWSKIIGYLTASTPHASAG